MALLDKVSDREGISIDISTGKSLVCLDPGKLTYIILPSLIYHVKYYKMLLGLDYSAQVFPLLLCWVDTCWILRTSMEQDLQKRQASSD
jgi:hypothetical protein